MGGRQEKEGYHKDPSCIGAILYLGHCCDFMDAKYIRMLQDNYKVMELKHQNSGMPLPRNKDLPHDKHFDRILRELDCATIEFMHREIAKKIQLEEKEMGVGDRKMFDSTRGVFTEGGPAFTGSGLFAKSHIQICIRNLNCIKGFFLPRREMDFPQWHGKNKPAA